jgi:Leucine-rich repeat (LRR) protein
MGSELDERMAAFASADDGVLDLSFLGLSQLPSALKREKNLVTLNAGFNSLWRLPDWIGDFPRLTRLNLEHNNLKSLPHTLGHVTGLNELSVTGNKLTELPSALANLTNLTALNLGGNALPELPDWLGALTGLTTLSLERLDNLTELPSWMANLVRLRELNVSSNYLATLPDWLDRCDDLTLLDVSSNVLSDLPKGLRSCTGLTTLRLGFNQFRELPAWLGELTHLAELGLELLGLTEMPGWIRGLTRLTSLRLWGNRLTDIPAWLGELTRLTLLDVSYNPLTSLPDALSDLNELNVQDTGIVRLPVRLTHLDPNASTLEANSDGPDVATDSPRSAPVVGSATGALAERHPALLSALLSHRTHRPIAVEARHGLVAAELTTYGQFMCRGRLVGCDPYLIRSARPFAKMVPPGMVLVETVTVHDERQTSRVALAWIRWTRDSPYPIDRVVRWERALVEGDPTGERSLMRVDYATAAYCDGETPAKFEAESAYHALTRSMEMTIPWQPHRKPGGTVVGLQCGMGDGSYPSFWGLDETGKVVGLLTDFLFIKGPAT